jgi:hypothetical protein
MCSSTGEAQSSKFKAQEKLKNQGSKALLSHDGGRLKRCTLSLELFFELCAVAHRSPTLPGR